MSAILTTLACLGAVLAAAPTAQDVEKGSGVVREHLAKLNGGAAQVIPITDEALGRAFPTDAFVAARFRLFPVAIEPPAPLKSQNLFIVTKDGKLQHLTDAKSLETYFRAALGPAKDEAALKDAARAWLRLSQEFHQDGFFKFSIPEASLIIGPEKEGKKVTGTAAVEPTGGNKGAINVALTFDAAGKLVSISENAKVLAGIRPRCQATKLLDADPIVRALAEQDILVMGAMAREYLNEQRAKASPELKQVIDRLWKRIVEEGR